MQLYTLLAAKFTAVDYVIVVVMALIVAAIVAFLIWKKATGRGGCCDCDGCPSSQGCSGKCSSCTSCAGCPPKQEDEAACPHCAAKKSETESEQ